MCKGIYIFIYSHINALLKYHVREAGYAVQSYRSPGGGGYSHTLPIPVCAAQRGRDFEAPGLERGIHFRGVF